MKSRCLQLDDADEWFVEYNDRFADVINCQKDMSETDMYDDCQ